MKKVKVVSLFRAFDDETGDTKKLSNFASFGRENLFSPISSSPSSSTPFASVCEERWKTRRIKKEALNSFSRRAPFLSLFFVFCSFFFRGGEEILNKQKEMAPWGKQRDSETNKNASSESLSTTPRDDDVNDEEQHERTKMKEQNQLSFSVAKAEMGEKTQPWTKQEDLKLQHMQEKYGNKWATVASQLPGRTGQQCAQRWRHRVNPNIRREKWTKEEDEKVILMMFVLSFSRFKNHHHLSRESREIRRFERRKRETRSTSAPA